MQGHLSVCFQSRRLPVTRPGQPVSSLRRQGVTQTRLSLKAPRFYFIVFFLIGALGCTNSVVPFQPEILSTSQLVIEATGLPVQESTTSPRQGTVTVFLSGDVMTGRGIDQILPNPSRPEIYEPNVKDAREYVRLAERKSGPILRPVPFDYIWGYALRRLQQESPDLRVINLETSITTSDAHWPGKQIHYRMHPKNVAVLKAARIDVCILANNHVLDWGYKGLIETVETLNEHRIRAVGVGRNLQQAAAPAVLKLDDGRVLVFSLGWASSGIPKRWAATENRPGVNLIIDSKEQALDRLQRQIFLFKRPGDVVIVSIHWGGNWGYDIPIEQVKFAHQLIDLAAVDIVQGHSSHYVKGIEVYQGKLILYGCGDLVNDYEGIRGHERFRNDLGLMYFPKLQPGSGRLVEMRMVPVQMENFHLKQPSMRDVSLLSRILNRECQKLGTRVELSSQDQTLELRW